MRNRLGPVMLDGGIHGSGERGTFIPRRRFKGSDRFKRDERSIEMDEIKESIDEPTRGACNYLVVIIEGWPKTVMQRAAAGSSSGQS